jgi:uncharacterized Zn finger protein
MTLEGKHKTLACEKCGQVHSSQRAL